MCVCVCVMCIVPVGILYLYLYSISNRHNKSHTPAGQYKLYTPLDTYIFV